MGKGWAVAFLFLSAAAVHAQEARQITAGTLNVRSGPGTGYAVVGSVSSGQVYVSVATSGSWRKIWYGESTGWVYSSYTTASSLAEQQVSASSLNVRTGPGTGYDVVGQAPGGSWWAVAGTSGSWKKIYFKGAARWVYGTYLGGSSTGGTTSSAGFIQLPASGTGFYSYSPASDRWGTPAMIYGLMNAFSSWDAQHDWPRIGVGDISLMNGGPMPGHASHQVGKDADLRPVRNDGVEGPTSVGYSSYSSSRTKDLITHHLKIHLNVKVIFFNDSSIYNSLSYVQYWDNHYNHLHVRIY
jgi:uncharacterized protein YraI